MKTPRKSTVTALAAVVATLYFAQEVLIPLALSILLAFLLAPAATRLERRGLRRVPAVLVVAALTFSVILLMGWVVGRQLVSLAEEIPHYRDEILRKASSLRGHGSGLSSQIQELGSEIEKATVQPATTRPTSPTRAGDVAENASRDIASNPIGVVAREAVGGPPRDAPAAPGTTPANPLFAVSLPAPVSPIRTLGTYLGLVLGPLGTVGLVIVFVVFLLLERQDLRDRLIRLISRGKYTLTTRALNDAGTRISRYILAQSIVNGSYGLVVALGLLVIGLVFGHGSVFPSFALWGLLCALLRFVPYVGPSVASLFPLAVSLAVFPGFGAFVATLSLIVLNELVSNNVVEPWLYGASTGLSSVALLVAAVFWTWLWGPVGLLLATPLTVCIVVLGKHVPQLAYLDVLLGDQPALPPGVRVYQRTLAGDRAEAVSLIRRVEEERGAGEVADTVFLPALRLTRRDRKDGDLPASEETLVLNTIEELIEERRVTGTDFANAPLVLGCPAHHRAEELTLKVLEQPAGPHAYSVEVASTRLLPAEVESRVREVRPAAVFIAVLPPGGIPQARYLCRRLRKEFPELPVVVGFWGVVKNFDRFLVRFRAAGASYVTTSMQQSRTQLVALLTNPADRRSSDVQR